MVTAAVRGLAVVAILVLVALVYFYFHPLLALWLLALSIVTCYSSTLGVAALFLAIPLDTAEPTLSGLVINFSEIEFAVVFLVWLAKVIETRELNWKAFLWGAPFLAAVAVSGFANISGHKVLPHLLRISELTIAMFLTANVYRDRIRGLTVAAADGVPAFSRRWRWPDSDSLNLWWRLDWLIAIAVTMFLGIGFAQLWDEDLVRISSSFGNANQFAGFLNLLLPFVLVFFFVATPRWSRVCWGYLIIALLAGLGGTQSRGAMIGAVVSALAIWVLFFWKSIPGFLKAPAKRSLVFLRKSFPFLALNLCVILSVAVLVVLLTGDYGLLKAPMQGFESRMGESFMGALEEHRLPFFKVGSEIWKDNPWLGVGPGRYRDVLVDYEELINSFDGEMSSFRYFAKDLRVHVHNLYLQLAVDFGLIGLVAFLYMVAALLLELLRGLERSPLRLAGVGLLVAFAIHNLLDVTFPSLGLEMGILIGIALGAGETQRSAGA